MSVKLLTEQCLVLLRLKGGCTGSYEATHVKIPHCWKSRVKAQNFDFLLTDDQFGLDLAAVTPQPPKRPQQNQPPNRSYSRHRPNQPLRQERPSEVPKMDFSSIEKLDDEPARLDKRPPKHPGHLTYAQVVKHDSYDEAQPGRHVDRGLTYVEQAYAKPGFHLPIIDASKQVCIIVVLFVCLI